MSSRTSPPQGLLVYFGEELSRYREAAGMTQAQLGRHTNYSTSAIGMIETGRRGPKAQFVNRCDELLGTPNRALRRILRLIVEETYPAWFRPYVELEAQAEKVLEYEAQAVPGILQTEAYARAILRAGRPRDTDEQIEQHVTARMERQAILRRARPPLLWVVLDEAVLRRPVGGPEVMREQLVRLREAAASPHVVLQIVPFEVGEHAQMGGSRIMLGLPDEDDVVYIEGVGSGQIIARPDEVAECALRFDLLRVVALTPEESLAWIDRTIGET